MEVSLPPTGDPLRPVVVEVPGVPCRTSVYVLGTRETDGPETHPP